MKERLEVAEKSLLLLIPYLILLSLAYYWGYWGYFSIDAISYYGVQDLIKGFAYTLPAVLILGITFMISNSALDFYRSFLRKRFNRVVGPILFAIPYVLFAYLYVNNNLPEITGEWLGPILLAVIIFTLLDAILMVIGEKWNWAIDNSVSFFIIKWLALFGIIAFFSAFAYGTNEARSIIKNRNFSYTEFNTLSDSTKIKSTFKYLGKAGDYYFFISPDNREKRIITVQTIPNLSLHDYDKDDSASVRAYRNFVKHK